MSTRQIPITSSSPSDVQLSGYLQTAARAAAAAILLLNLTPLSFTHYLPLKELHNPLTLFFILLAICVPTTWPASMNALLVVVFSLRLQLATINMHGTESTKQELIEYMLMAATAGTGLHLLAHALMLSLWLAIVFMALALLGRKKRCIFPTRETGDRPLLGSLVHFVRLLHEDKLSSLLTLLVRLPGTLVNATTPAFLVQWYIYTVKESHGALAYSVSVKDIVTFGVAGSVGLFLGKYLFVRLWKADEVKVSEVVLVRVLGNMMWATVNVSSSVYVSTEIAGNAVSPSLVAKSDVVSAVFMVFIFRALLTLLEVAERATRSKGRENEANLFWLAHIVSVFGFAHMSVLHLANARQRYGLKSI